MPKRITDQEYKACVLKKYGTALSVLEPYVNISTKIKHRCNKCGDVRLRHPQLVMGSKTSPDRMLCCYQRPTTDSYVSELKALGSTLRPIEEYKGRLKKIMHRCTACNSERKMLPGHIIKGHGCFICAKDKQRFGHFERKVVELAGVTHKLQGFEPQALDYMLRSGAKPENIVTTVQAGKPTFEYKFKGKTYTYIPDFYHKSKERVVEVKSTWTLGVATRSEETPFKKNAAKAKAAIAAGYKFTLLLMNRAGERIRLPEDWYNLTQDEVRALVR